MAAPRPDYLSRDFDGLKASLLDYASQTYPEWQPSSEGDFGMVLLELFAYVGDVNSYYTDRAQFENYLGTATQRDSVQGIAYLLGYLPNSGAPAKGTVKFRVDKGQGATVVPAGTKILTGRLPAIDGPVTFETDEDATVPAWTGDTPGLVTVAVTEGVTEEYTKIGESTGAPAQQYSLPDTGVYRDTIKIYVEDVAGSNVFTVGQTEIKAREWVLKDHLLEAGPSDLVFETQYVDDATIINFGDDINGAIPATGLQIFATYRHGVGSYGNVPAGQVYQLNNRSTKGVHVNKDNSDMWESSEMTGGTDPEGVDSIRFNAPRAYRTQERIVTTQDFIDAALGVEGVGKANVLIGTFSSVTVFITGADGKVPTQTLIDLVQARLTDRTLAGVTVTVVGPTLVPVNFGASGDPIVVELFNQFSRKGVKAAVRRAIRTFISEMRFGERLTVSKIYRALEEVEGVRYVEIPVMARDDSAQTGTAKINPREWEVFTAGTININLVGGVA